VDPPDAVDPEPLPDASVLPDPPELLVSPFFASPEEGLSALPPDSDPEVDFPPSLPEEAGAFFA